MGTRRKGSTSDALHGYPAKEQHPVADISKAGFVGCWAMEKNSEFS